MSQKENHYEKVYFFTYGSFDKELFLSEFKRRPDDKRLKFICNNIVDIQSILMMSLQGDVKDFLSLLNATKLFTNRDDLEQDHNSLNDAKLLKLLYKNIGQPNIDNLIMAEKKRYVRQVKKLYGTKQLKNKSLRVYLKKRETLENLTFDEIKEFEDSKTLKEIEKVVKKNYWLLSEEYYYDSIFDRIVKKEG